jgi:hypothetical protein
VVGEGEGYHKPTILHGEGPCTHGKKQEWARAFSLPREVSGPWKRPAKLV